MLLCLFAIGAQSVPVGAAPGCPEAPAPVRAAVRESALAWAQARYPELVQDVRVARVCGDWAMAVLVPKERVNPAAIILTHDADLWRVVAGPGTVFPPESRPAGVPAALFGEEMEVH